MIPTTWREKLVDAIVDRNVFYTLVFIPVLWLAVPVADRLEAFGLLTGFAFGGGTAKTVMNGIKAKAAILSGGAAPGTGASPAQGS